MRLAVVFVVGCASPGPVVVPIAKPPIDAAPDAAPDAAVPEPTPLGKLPLDVRPTHERLALHVDPRVARFGGTAELELELDRPRTTIWMHGRGLAVSSVTVDGVAARWDEVDPIGVARVTVPSPVHGHVVVQIAYDAPYDPSLVGAYRVGSDAVFTKFEAIYARRAFPCFDEPRFKIPFDVMLDVPAWLAVVANMPIAMDLTLSGVRRVTFATTPPLPTYLVAFAVGPFETRAATARPTIGAVAWRGRGKDTAFALAEEPAIVAEEERYFGLPFPYPKLDLVAVPEFQSGAMENAGAIAFRDSALLVDDRVTSFQQRKRVIEILAHETVHQWFGDLVTMPWWDDLWLNEGFATFLATRTLRTIHPELLAELDAIDSASDVMSADSLASARRIRQPIESTHDITNAFDGITYDKGAAVLAMLEHHAGDAAFQRGVHAFLAAHATASATTDDLIAALSHESGKDLAPIARSFLDRPGVPVVTVRTTCDADHGHAILEQARWQPIGAGLPDEGPWAIPVCLATNRGETCTVLATKTATIDLPACVDYVVPNAGGVGYYRTVLPPEELARVERAMGPGVSRVTTAERLSIAHDVEAAFRSGALPGADVLAVFDARAGDPSGAVAAVPFATDRFVADFMLDDRARAAMRAHLAKRYLPAARALGWSVVASDPASRRIYRTRVHEFLALDLEERAILDEAAARGRRYLAGRTDAVDPDLLGVALAAAARRGDAKTLDALLALLARSTDSQLRTRILSAIGNVRAPDVVARALDLVLDPKLHATDRLIPLEKLLRAVATRDTAWTWLGAHFDALVAMLPDRYGGSLPGMYAACDPARTEALATFFTPRVEHLTGGPRNLANAIEAAEQCTARVAAQRASVAAYAAKL